MYCQRIFALMKCMRGNYNSMLKLLISTPLSSLLTAEYSKAYPCQSGYCCWRYRLYQCSETLLLGCPRFDRDIYTIN